MAFSTYVCALLMLLLVIVLADADGIQDEGRSLLVVSKIDCPAKCDYRCSETWRKKLCNKMCLVCCEKCSCVPNGPKESKSVCPCYNKLKNNKGGSKCP